MSALWVEKKRKDGSGISSIPLFCYYIHRVQLVLIVHGRAPWGLLICTMSQNTFFFFFNLVIRTTVGRKLGG